MGSVGFERVIFMFDDSAKYSTGSSLFKEKSMVTHVLPLAAAGFAFVWLLAGGGVGGAIFDFFHR